MATKIIIFCPAGRKNMLEVQLLNILKLLDLDVVHEYHIWDVSWCKEDSDFISGLDKLHSKIRIKHTPFTNASRAGQVASQQFAYILCDFYNYDEYSAYNFVKLDDDIAFVDANNFTKFIEHREKSDAFLCSANVVNNNHLLQDDRTFYAIHTDFTNNYNEILEKNNKKDAIVFSNDARLSINFVSFLGKDLKHINAEFSNGIGSGDEGRLCNDVAKRLNRQNEICLFFTVVHYKFGGRIDPKFISHYKEIYQKLFV